MANDRFAKPMCHVAVMQENAFNPRRTTEADTWKDGQYNAGLLSVADIPSGSNIRDDHLCPNTVRRDHNHLMKTVLVY